MTGYDRLSEFMPGFAMLGLVQTVLFR